MKKTVIACAASVVALTLAGTASSEEIKEGVFPSVNGSPVTLMRDNLITQKLGGRLVNLDVWAGEFIRHDSNVFNTKSKKSDTIYTTAAGFLLQAEQNDQWKLTSQGQFMHNRYKDLKDFNGNEGFFHVNGSYTFSPAVTARLSAGYDQTYERVRDLEDIFDNKQFTLGAGATISPTARIDVDVDYGYLKQDRERLSEFEYDEHSFSVRPSYKFTPNTKGYFQLGVSKVDAKGNHYNDSTNYSGVFGLAWNYRDTANAYGEAGFVSMHFDDNGTVTNYQDKSKTLPKFRIGGNLALTTDWKLNAQFSYAPQVGAVSTSAGNSAYIKEAKFSAGVIYSPGAGRFTAHFTPYVSKVDPSANTDYREFGATLGVSYSIRDWINVSAGYRCSNLKYSGDSSVKRNQIMAGLAITL